MAGRGCDDQLDVGCSNPARRHDQSAIWCLGEALDRAFNLIWFTKIDRAYFNADRWRNCLYYGELANSVSKTGIAKNGRLLHARRELPEQFQPLSAQVVLKHHEAGGVAAGP